MRTTEPGKGMLAAAQSNRSMMTVPSKVWLALVSSPVCGLPNHESDNGTADDFSAVKTPTVTSVTLMLCNGLNQTDRVARASSKAVSNGLPVVSSTVSTARNANSPSSKLSRSRSPAANLLLRSSLTRIRKWLPRVDIASKLIGCAKRAEDSRSEEHTSEIQ